MCTLAALAASVFSFAAGAEDPGELALRVVGKAEGSGFAARQGALQNAREEVIWEILRSKVASGDFRPFRSMVRNAERYITRSVELKLSTEAGETRVELDAYVDIQAVEHDLATLMLPRLATPPTVTCLIAREDEKGELYLDSPGLAEKTMVEGLDKLGLAARTHLESEVPLDAAGLRAALTGDMEKASRYVRETLSDAVVLGVLRVEPAPARDLGGTARTRATLDAHVFRGADGDLIEVFARSAVITCKEKEQAPCVEEATIDTATKMLGDITVATVLSVLGAQKPDEVLLTVVNPGSRERMKELAGVLDADTSVDFVEESFFSERLARLRVGYAGPMGYLVDLMLAHRYGGWSLEVDEAVGRDVKMSLRAPEG